MKTNLNFKGRHTIVLAVFSLALLNAMLLCNKASAYVMPAEQLLHLMGANFSRFKTLVVIQSAQLKDLNGQEKDVALNEKIWLKAPDFYYSEFIDMPEDQDPENGAITDREPGGDMSFRRLLLADDPEARITLLSDMGVETESVALTRFEGTIAYQLGEKDPESPKLVIDKDTFLPMLFCYWSKNDSGRRIVTVRFGNYQKLGKGWYPFEIVYSGREGSIERYSVLDLKINTPIDLPLSEIVVERSLPHEPIKTLRETPEDERLREMIELLKDKYK